jgi:hypothetical protein
MHAASMTRFWAIVCTVCVGVCSAGVAEGASIPSSSKARIVPVDFERHIMGLFGRLGCNAGSCHGSFQGKGGFRLSLFGYDPEKDYLALTRDGLARRVNPVDPDRSLLLLKATGQIGHEGGLRFGKTSWQYEMFRRWIQDGARWKKGSGEVTRVVVQPAEYSFAKAGETGQLKVRARFTDGTEEDITPLCDYRTNDDAVAEVSSLGRIKALRAGDTAIVVSYRGTVVPVRVMVPMTLPKGFVYPKTPAVSYIDREVFAKLRRLNIAPSALAGDAEFLRRVTIDTIGSLPSPAEVRAFLADKDPLKRAKKIDELLTHPMHAALWATRLSDVTGNNTDALEQPQQLKPKRSQMWHDWLRKRIADNVPYDEIVHGVLCATSREGMTPEEWIVQAKELETASATGFETPYASRKTLDLFWRRQQAVPIDQWGQKTAAAFMGVRIECAECHKHPFDRWTQVDYRSYANLFGQVAFGISPEGRKVIDKENLERRKQVGKNQKNKKGIPLVPLREVFVGQPFRVRRLNHPDTNKPLAARALGGPEIALTNGEDPREKLFQWLRSPDNPFFARSFANRVWGHYFGVGIVDPVDNFSLANPPSNDRLLNALAKDFVDHQFDIRHLERAILNSRVYQLSSAANLTNRLDRNNYSHSFIRPMMAEVVVDVLNTALGVSERFGNEARPNSRAIEVGSSRIQNPNLAYAFRIFGRPPRTTACDCERAMEPALPQTLYLMTDPILLRKIQTGRLQQLLADKKTDDEVLEELFLATLGRYPNSDDKKLFAEYQAGKADGAAKNARRDTFTDTLWALINTREFILNH